MRFPVECLKPVYSTDLGGGQSVEFVKQFDAFCDIKPMVGRRAFEYQSVIGVRPVEITMRIDPNNQIESDWIIRHNKYGQIIDYTVHSIIDEDFRLNNYKIIAYNQVK